VPLIRLGLLLVGIALSVQCAAPGRPLRIGLVVWPVYELAVLARSLGRLDSKRVHLLDYGSSSEALRAYQRGVIDGVALTTSNVIELLALSSKDRIVLVIDVSTGGDALVASANIKSVPDLKGRRIGLETGSLGLLVLSRALEHGDLARTDVHVVPVDASGQEAAFNAGVVDAIVTYEPTRSTLVARGARDIFNSSMMPNEIVDVLVVRESAVREREQALAHLMDAWFFALDYLRRHPVDAAARVAPREDLTADAYLASLKGVKILNRDENQRWLSGDAPLLDDHLASLADVMLRTGLLTIPVQPGSIGVGRFIQ
jgi:NitT/TauT family transport system substrate-binding protein